MKTILIAVTVCFHLCNVIYAQCPSNGTHTDPNPNYVAPNVNSFRKNTFDWKTSTFLHAKQSAPYSGVLNSPFYSTTLNYPFASAGSSDFDADEGWELIKQDMGYFYDNTTGTWNGVVNGNGTIMGLSPALSGDPRGTGSNVYYVVLYNKYSSLLRVYASINNSMYNDIYVRLRFLEAATDYNNTQNPALAYQPNVNALFNHYNVKSALALDQQTVVKEVAGLATFPNSNAASEMLYADFQLAYDPCVCLFQSGFEVSFEAIQTANLSLSGRYAGVVSTVPLAPNVVNYNGSIYGNNAGDKFVASVFNNGGSPASIIQSYNDQLNLFNSPSNQPSIASQNISNAISTFQTIIPIAAAAFGGGNIPGTEIAVKKALDGLSKALDFASTKVEPELIPKPIPITVNSGYMTLNGQMTTVNQFPGINFRIGVPGSLPPSGLTTFPEYAPAANNGQPYPNHPVFNEVPGAFALLKTPEVREFTSSAFDNQTFGHNHNFGIVRAYNPASNLQYALNPIYDQSKTKIYVSYEMTGAVSFMADDNTFSNPPVMIELFKNHTIQGWEAASSYVAHEVGDIFGGTQAQPAITNINRYKLRSASLPIGCNTSIYLKESYAFDATTSSNPSLFANTYTFDNYIPHDIYLVVLLDLVSLPDQYGKVHRTSQIIKYKCKKITTNTDFTLSGNAPSAMSAFASYNVGANVNLNATTYSAPQTITSKLTTNVTGNQINNSPNNGVVNITAGSQVFVNSQVDLVGEIGLYINPGLDYFSNCSDQTILPIMGTALTNYCQNSGVYAANGYLANTSRIIGPQHVASEPPENVTALKSIEKQVKNIGIYPNPTDGVLYLDYYTSSRNDIFVQIEDLLGKILNKQKIPSEEGRNQTQINLNFLENGIYIIRIVDAEGALCKTEKIVISK